MRERTLNTYILQSPFAFVSNKVINVRKKKLQDRWVQLNNAAVKAALLLPVWIMQLCENMHLACLQRRRYCQWPLENVVCLGSQGCSCFLPHCSQIKQMLHLWTCRRLQSILGSNARPVMVCGPALHMQPWSISSQNKHLFCCIFYFPLFFQYFK